MANISQGVVALIVWAHCLLGLTVHVQDLSSQITVFGASGDVPSVLIREKTPGSAVNDEIILLDAASTVVIRCNPDPESSVLALDDNEKHALLDWATEKMRRHFNSVTLVKDEDPVYLDTASLITAMVLNALPALKFAGPGGMGWWEDIEGLFHDLGIEAWRVFDSANVLFHSLKIKREALKAHIDLVKEGGIDEITLPKSIERVFGKMQVFQPKTDIKYMDRITRDLIAELASAVLTFAHVYDIGKCAALPISLRSSPGPRIFPPERASAENEALSPGQSSIFIQRDQFHESAMAYMFGSMIVKQPKNCFINSRHGWSIMLGSGYAADPSEIMPSMLRIQQGVPTHTTTDERKRYVCDGTIWRSTPSNWRVVDTGKSYVPRSLAIVTHRKEFCTTFEDHFQVAIQVNIRYEGLEEEIHGVEYCHWHSNLWCSFRTKPCECPTKTMDRADLGFNAATVTGNPWIVGERMSSNDIEQRVCIYLAQEHRALCLKSRGMYQNCNVVLKTKDCCETCAFSKASALPGKVLLIV